MIRALASVWTVVLMGLVQLSSYVAPPVTVVVWHSGSEREQQALEQAGARFTRINPSTRVQFVGMPCTVLDEEVGHAGRAGPDLFISGHERIPDLVRSGVIERIDPWLTLETTRRYVPVALQALTRGGSTYGLPMALESLALIYNRKLVKSPPTDTAGMVRLAKGLTDAVQNRYGLVYEIRRSYPNSGWLFGFGGGFLDRDGQIRLDCDGNVRALSFVSDLCHRHKLMPREVSRDLVAALFNRGQAAMVIADARFLREISSTIEFGVAPLPSVEGRTDRATPFLSVQSLQMSARSAHKQEAFEVMRYLAGREASVIMATTGGMPVANAAAYDDPAVRRLPHLTAFRQQAERSIPVPGTPEMRAIRRCLDTAFRNVIQGGVQPRRALGEAQTGLATDLGEELRTSRR